MAVIAEQRLGVDQPSFSNRMFALVFSDGIDDELRREKVLFGRSLDETHFFVKAFVLLKERCATDPASLVALFQRAKEDREVALLEAAMAAGEVDEDEAAAEATVIPIRGDDAEKGKGKQAEAEEPATKPAPPKRGRSFFGRGKGEGEEKETP